MLSKLLNLIIFIFLYLHSFSNFVLKIWKTFTSYSFNNNVWRKTS
nr:MAG TPA: hypothetical protein [Caudoviricetes sp.]